MTAYILTETSGQRSRAARRAVSPSLNLDRSLKNVKPPAESVDHRPSILSIHYGAGVTKKNKKRADLSHKKRKRLEKGMARAEFAMDKLELKVAKSIGRGKTIKGRKVRGIAITVSRSSGLTSIGYVGRIELFYTSCAQYPFKPKGA